jgi:hypothetical protein
MGILNKKIKRKWLTALRSGKYKQTRTAQLHNKKANSYCCLGVLQHCLNGEIDGYLIPREGWYADNGMVNIRDQSYNGEIKLSKNNNSIEDKLTSLNDSAKYNFAKIADWIEENL